MPRASSGSFFAPNKTRTISRMTIKSGPAKFMKLARRLIPLATSDRFSELQGISVKANELTAEDRLRLTGRALWESIPSYASHLERQHQLRAGLHSSGGLSRHARGEAQFPAPPFQRSQSNQFQKGGGGGL